MKFPFVSRLAPYLQSALRIAAAFIFLLHGTQKIFAYPGGARTPLVSLLGAAGAIELAGGTLMLLGLFARPVALVLAAEMAMAYYRTHMPRGTWPILNGGEAGGPLLLHLAVLQRRRAGTLERRRAPPACLIAIRPAA